jgi:phosphoglycerate kinase
MANNILNYMGNPIGKSIRENNCEKIIDDIFKTAKIHTCSIIYPEDVIVGKNLEDKGQTKELNKVLNDDLILDIGPKTINKIKDIIEISKTVLWNGPAGYFENPNFANGSYEIAKKIVTKNKNNLIYSIAGGGDTIALLNQVGASKNFNFISTAGGAFLEFLEGKELPGIKALN